MRNLVLGIVGVAALCASAINAQSRATRWRIAPDLVIDGNAPGAAELDISTGITVGPDGAVYVMQPTENRFRIFEIDGQYRGELGRPGAGPGEFRSISAFGWLSDTLWITDRSQRRIVFFDSKGRHLRTVADAAPADTRVLAQLSSGKSLTQQGDGDAREATARLAIQAEGGGHRTPLIEYRIAPEVLELQKGRFVRNAFVDNPVVAVCPGGTRFYVVESRAPANDSAAYNIRQFGSDGKLLGQLSSKIRATQMPNGFVDSVQRSFAQGYIRMGAISESDYFAVVHRSIPHRRFHRAFDFAKCASNGDLWLHLAGAESSWVIFDASISIQGLVDLPANSQLGYAGVDHVWVIQHDDLDVPRIVRYKLARPKTS